MRLHVLWPCAALLLLPACSAGRKKIVLYCAGDRIFSETLIRAFTEKTGIEVETASDTEPSRGVALRRKIEQERRTPRADVYWNNELVNTIVLKQEGLLAAYKSPSAQDIPEAFADPEGTWTAFGARARVFIVNTDRVPEAETPVSFEAFLDPKWRGKAGISLPTGGTTATHAAALFTLWGDEKAKEFYARMMENGVVPCSGNGHVMSQVAAGELLWGWTDTNDCNVAIRDGKPVKVVYPDQEEGGLGTLLIPHSVSLIKDAPHPVEAKAFIDFLLSRDTERALAHGLSVQIPLRRGVETPAEAGKHFIMDIAKIRTFNDRIDWNRVGDALPRVIVWMNENFVK